VIVINYDYTSTLGCNSLMDSSDLPFTPDIDFIS